jgi:hypothetical protein
MKKLILLIFTTTIILSSCNNSDVQGRPVIKAKFLYDKEGICKYYYNGLGTRGQEFHDSCNKYNIGDTIL